MQRAMLAILAILVLSLAFVMGCGDDSSSNGDIGPIDDAITDQSTGDAVIDGADDGSDDGSTTDPPSDTSAPDTTTTEACDPVDQIGCPTGQKCQIDRQGEPECLPAPALADAAAAGEACGGDTGISCGAGLQCIVVDGEAACHNICRTDGTGCESNEVCNINPATASRYMYCSSSVNCDVLTQEGCELEQACVGGNDPTIGFITLCQSAGTAQQGETCSSTVSCVAGATCLRFTDAGTETYKCVTYCDENDGTCPTTATCNDGAAIGFDGDWAHVGLCY